MGEKSRALFSSCLWERAEGSWLNVSRGGLRNGACGGPHGASDGAFLLGACVFDARSGRPWSALSEMLMLNKTLSWLGRCHAF